MTRIFQKLVAAIWNRAQGRRRGAWQDQRGSLNLGFQVVDGQVTRHRVSVSNTQRTLGSANFGVTGSGKSRYLLHQSGQDIDHDIGFLSEDPHGEFTQSLLQRINARERREHRHLSDKLVLIQPADPVMSIGLNPLEQETPDFVRIAEVAEIIRLRCGLDHFGVRIQETLTNTLFALSANKLTLLEIPIFLANANFRRACMKQVENAEVRQYFEQRYDRMSSAMQAAVREPVLNKVSSLIADPSYRHIVGQVHSTFNARDVMDAGCWVLADLPKARLGAHASTLGSLIFTQFKNGLFAREKRSLFSFVLDELQNFVGGDIETVLTEARKFSTPIASANQTLAQLTPELRSALFATGTQTFFRLSPPDADEKE